MPHAAQQFGQQDADQGVILDEKHAERLHTPQMRTPDVGAQAPSRTWPELEERQDKAVRGRG